MDNMTALKSEAKTSQSPPTGWLQLSHKPGLLHVSGRDLDQTQKVKVNITYIILKMVSVILIVVITLTVCSSVFW